jgi:hypothetical protein
MIMCTVTAAAGRRLLRPRSFGALLRPRPTGRSTRLKKEEKEEEEEKKDIMMVVVILLRIITIINIFIRQGRLAVVGAIAA